MKKGKELLIISLLFICTTPVFARLGGSTGQFLTIGGGARASALGGAYSAFAEGIDAIYWNPAGIAKIYTPMVNFVHSNLFPGADMSKEDFAFVVPVSEGTIGVSAMALLSGDIERTTESYQDGLPVASTYSANSYAVGISYARRMTNKFNAGITLKGINQNIYKVSANGVAADIGGVYNTELQNLRFGFMIQNFGPDIVYGGELLRHQTSIDTLQNEDVAARYETEPDPLPLSFQMGLAMDVLSTPLYTVALSADLVHLPDQEPTYALGAEVSLQDRLYTRIGYSEKNTGGLTCGFGLGVQKFIFDYTYQAHKHLAGIHRIGVSLVI